MSRSHKDQRKHRRKAWKNGNGVGEHAKREKRRRREERRRKIQEQDDWIDANSF